MSLTESSAKWLINAIREQCKHTNCDTCPFDKELCHNLPIIIRSYVQRDGKPYAPIKWGFTPKQTTWLFQTFRSRCRNCSCHSKCAYFTTNIRCPIASSVSSNAETRLFHIYRIIERESYISRQ